MINSNIRLTRYRNEWQYVLRFYEFPEYDKITIEITDDKYVAQEIISVSNGSFSNGQINISNKTRDVTIQFACSGCLYIICNIIQHLGKERYPHISTIQLPKKPALSSQQNEVTLIKLDNIDRYSSEQMYEYMKLLKSKWDVTLSVDNNILLTVNRMGGQNGYICFGDLSATVGSSDVVFMLRSDLLKITIPKELVWSKYNYYKGSKLGCFEVVGLESCSIRNIFYKVPISNKLSFSEIPAKQHIELGRFVCPTGVPFDPHLWKVDETSGLPRLL